MMQDRIYLDSDSETVATVKITIGGIWEKTKHTLHLI
jgi:hypothetical protein